MKSFFESYPKASSAVSFTVTIHRSRHHPIAAVDLEQNTRVYCSDVPWVPENVHLFGFVLQGKRHEFERLLMMLVVNIANITVIVTIGIQPGSYKNSTSPIVLELLPFKAIVVVILCSIDIIVRRAVVMTDTTTVSILTVLVSANKRKRSRRRIARTGCYQ